MIPVIERAGVRPSFPSVKAYLKSYVFGVEDWESRLLVELRNYATGDLTEIRIEVEGETIVLPYHIGSAGATLGSVSAAYRWMAIQGSLRAEPNNSGLWARATAYAYWGLRLETRFRVHALAQFERGERPRKLSLFVNHFGMAIANCLVLNWQEWAIDLTRRAHWALDNDVFNDGDDAAHRRTDHFILRLIGRWQGWPERKKPSCAFDEPLFNALVDHWATPNANDLAPLLLAACDRHTFQARPDNSKTSFDMSWHGVHYDPFEVLAVLKLRELHSLPNPVLDHPLMNTPLGRLPAPTEPYSDELLDGVLARARMEFPDL